MSAKEAIRPATTEDAVVALAHALHASWCDCDGFGNDEYEYAKASVPASVAAFRKKHNR